jgi:hypothetical protein
VFRNRPSPPLSGSRRRARNGDNADGRDGVSGRGFRREASRPDYTDTYNRNSLANNDRAVTATPLYMLKLR